MSVQIARWTNVLPKVCICFHFLQFPQWQVLSFQYGEDWC